MSKEPKDANVTLFDPEMGSVPMDGKAFLVNQSDVPTASIYEALNSKHPEIAALVRWQMSMNGDSALARQSGIFSRDRYVSPDRIFDKFDVARDACVHDDVVSGVIESTESLAFGRTSFVCDDEDEEDIWNQIGMDIDIDARIREMWRELFVCSQFYAVSWFGQKDFRIRGKSDTGYTRKKSFPALDVPVGVTILDPKKVVPVGNLMFNQEQLAYVADRTEVDMLDAAVLNDPGADPVSRQIIVAKYAPPDYERRNLAKIGVNADWLYILNPKNVWRHTLTRPQHQRFADVRMGSVFDLLDLKQQLRQMDRSYLIGGTNYLMVVTKGTDHLPAKPEEITNLNAQIATVARVPILVGDHRLKVEIITPKMDRTLSAEMYGTIDQRITTRLYQMFIVHGGIGAARSDDSVKLAKVIAKGLEARRYMLKRTIEREVIIPTIAANDSLHSMPKLRFHPTRIELDFDPALMQILIDIRDRGDLSRETVLAELDLDQEDEARLRQREAKTYDDIFTPTNVPFDGAGAAGGNPAAGGGANVPGGVNPATNPRSAGRNMGGNRGGGGAAPGSGQGQAPRGPAPKDKNRPRG